MRIGLGYDVHRFDPGRPLVLGGVEIPHHLGLAGHSDADVLLHAVMDALLGAACLGDLGRHFPPSDPAYRGISSLSLLQRTALLIAGEGLELSNLDSTIVCQSPRLAPHIPSMRRNVAGVLGCAEGRISIKATTEEGLGFTGRGEGMAAHAVVLLRERGGP